jgi:hypothetical protein
LSGEIWTGFKKIGFSTDPVNDAQAGYLPLNVRVVEEVLAAVFPAGNVRSTGVLYVA